MTELCVPVQVDDPPRSTPLNEGRELPKQALPDCEEPAYLVVVSE
jgi:hypothetical protein